MVRKPRVEFEGAFYHVIGRGNQRQRIFRDDRDRLYYLKRVEHYQQRYQFRIYAYVLMSNHVHFLLETGKHRYRKSSREFNLPTRSTITAVTPSSDISFRGVTK